MTDQSPAITVDQHYDVVVVGAGSSGAALAARLSERSDRRVLLVDGGPDRSTAEGSSRSRDPDRLPGDADARVTSTPVEVGRSAHQPPLVGGQLVGGSSAVNGAYFVRPTRADLDDWAARGNDRWSFDALLPAFRRLENDLDLGATELHGAGGPIPVQRGSAPIHPVTGGFFEACSAAGHDEHLDLNDGGEQGWGLVPRNVDAGGRVDTAAAYLDPARGRPNLEIRGGWAVSELLVDRDRVVGVRGPPSSPQFATADQIVLCAGALASPQLVERAIIQRVEQRPTRSRRPRRPTIDLDNGCSVALHPAVDLYFETVEGVDLEMSPLVQGALHHVLESGATAEVLAMCRPYGRATGAAPHDRALSLRVSLMSARTRARHHTGSAGGWLELRGPGRWVPQDRDDLREAVRSATALATSGPLSALVDTWHGPGASVVSNNDALDGWIAQRLVVSMHAAGSAPMGPDDGRAVVDQSGRVHGLEGVRIVDTSILPGLPSRGPACIAVALAEHLAPSFD